MRVTNAHIRSPASNLEQCPSSEERVSVTVNGIPFELNVLDSLMVIQEKFGLNQMRFVANGRLLLNSASLKFNGIQNGDTIIALPPKQKQEEYLKPENKRSIHKDKCVSADHLKEIFDRKWAHKVADPDAVRDQVLARTNPSTARECARLSDLFKIRVESNMSVYRKICLQYNEGAAGYSSFDNTGSSLLKANDKLVTILSEKPSTPSTSFLPQLWLQNAQEFQK